MLPRSPAQPRQAQTGGCTSRPRGWRQAPTSAAARGSARRASRSVTSALLPTPNPASVVESRVVASSRIEAKGNDAIGLGFSGKFLFPVQEGAAADTQMAACPGIFVDANLAAAVRVAILCDCLAASFVVTCILA